MPVQTEGCFDSTHGVTGNQQAPCCCIADFVCSDESGLKKLTISSGDAEAEIFTLGGCVTSFKASFACAFHLDIFTIYHYFCLSVYLRVLSVPVFLLCLSFFCARLCLSDLSDLSDWLAGSFSLSLSPSCVCVCVFLSPSTTDQQSITHTRMLTMASTVFCSKHNVRTHTRKALNHPAILYTGVMLYPYQALLYTYLFTIISRVILPDENNRPPPPPPLPDCNTDQVADYDYLFVRPDAKMDGSKPSEWGGCIYILLYAVMLELDDPAWESPSVFLEPQMIHCSSCA